MFSRPPNLISILASADLFRSLEPSALESFASQFEFVALPDGQRLIRQGDADDSLYVILSGRVVITAKDASAGDKELARLGAGQTVGELALLTGDTRSATVSAFGATHLAKLPEPSFVELVERYPAAGSQITQAILRRLEKTRLSFALHLSHLFGDLNEAALRDLEHELEPAGLKGGEILLRQGDPGDALYLVVSGRLRVAVRQEDGAERDFAELGCGEIVGDMAVVSGEPRTATVRAIRDTQLARLSRAGFERLVLRHPQEIVRTFTAKVVARLREQISGGHSAPPSIRTIAVIPASCDPPLSDFCRHFAQALSLYGGTVLLNSEFVDSALGRKNAAQSIEGESCNVKLVEWLSRQETDHNHVVYQADLTPTQWSRRCLRQADHVLILGMSGADPAPSAIEGELLQSYDPSAAARKSLVMLHVESSVNPSGTKAWLAARDVQRHHHVRLNASGDFERLARFLLGRAVGLALGGGFARALAHVGVMRAFSQLGVPIDAVGGTSMGSIIGAQWALGWNEETMIRETCAGCVDSFNDLTLPFLAFKSGKFFSAVIEKFFGDTQIEDLWFPYFCVSANLNRAEVKVHTSGALTKAVLASTRAPVIFPPIIYDGELHVDGGVLNNVPVDIMKIFSNGGIVIGVDVSPPHELTEIYDYGASLNGWRAAWGRFNPFTRQHTYLPSVLLVIMRTIEFGGLSFKSGLGRYADLYLRPPTLQFMRNEFQSASKIADVGYRHALEKMDEWLREMAKVGARDPRRPSHPGRHRERIRPD